MKSGVVPEKAEEFLRVTTSGGNYMLNVGPDGDGRIPLGYRRIVAELGPWIREAAVSGFRVLYPTHL